MNTTIHHGQIIEKMIRRQGFSITSLAKAMDVERKTVYSWFNQRILDFEIVQRIGETLDHDFTNDLFEKRQDIIPMESADLSDTDYWKNKYISLLEKYNDILHKSLEKSSDRV